MESLPGTIQLLTDLRRQMLDDQARHTAVLDGVHPVYRSSAENLIHYLSLRRVDLREVQAYLSSLGLSSVGHSERYTLRNVSNILYLLHLLNGKSTEEIRELGLELSTGVPGGRIRHKENTERLFGPERHPGHTRIMVTLPTEAATDRAFVRQLYEQRVELLRINTGHDDPLVWAGMIDAMAEAGAATGHRAQLYMDLAGPKLRTGPIARDRSAAKSGAKKAAFIELREGDILELTREQKKGRPAVVGKKGKIKKHARISTSLPEVFDFVKSGERIFFDDGKIGGVISSATDRGWLVRINHTGPKGAKLRSDKGINLPDSLLELPALTDYDREVLPFVAAHADLVGYSFVQRPEDVEELRTALEALGAGHRGIILKIETKRAFDHLPELLLNAMKSPLTGVMVARGDLAVELGWTRIAEVQEEISWICEAAHLPMIWATQILETQVKTGLATRAEITDAVAAVQAECAMLNKGPYVLKGVKTLRSIDRRMHAHFEKKMGSLRPLQVAERFF